MDKHLFDAFNPVSEADWLDQVKRDLKDQQVDRITAVYPYEGISLPSYFTSSPEIFVPGHPNPGWNIRVNTGEWSSEQWKSFMNSPTPGIEEWEAPSDVFDKIRSPGDLPASARILYFQKMNDKHMKKATDFLKDRKQSNGLHALFYDPIYIALISGKWSYSAGEDLETWFFLGTQITKENPGLRWISANGSIYGNAGGSAVHELAFTAAHLNAYLHQVKKSGTAPRLHGGQVEVKLAIGGNYLLEIAKFRAARIIVHQLLESYGTAQPHAFHLTAESNTLNHSTRDVNSNLLRQTTACLSAVIGGCQSVILRPHTNSQDPFGQRVAMNTQLVLRHEAHIDKGRDSVAGSYFLGHLTKTLAEKAWSAFQKLEDKGGLITSLEKNKLQQAITQTAAQRIQRFREKRDVIIGANKYQLSDTAPKDSGTQVSKPTGDFEALHPLYLEASL